MRKLSCLLLIVIYSSFSNAQLNYKFTAVTSSYLPILGYKDTLQQLFPTSQGTSPYDEGYKNNIPIGFNFYFNGNSTPITTLDVCSNGFVTLGTHFPSGINNSQAGYYSNDLTNGPIINGSPLHAQRPIIAPFWADLDLSSSNNLVHKTTGTPGSQVFTIQWSNALWDYSASRAAISFQLKLYEGTNVIEFVYQKLLGNRTNGAFASIGIADTSSGFLNFMSVNDVSNKAYASRLLENNQIIATPATGQVFRFTPVNPLNDAVVYQFYTLGSVAANNESYPFSANIINVGSTTIRHIPVCLNVTGNNHFSDTTYIDSLLPAKNKTVFFKPFKPITIGNDTASIILGLSDDDSANNVVQRPLNITYAKVSTAYDAITNSAFGFGSSNGPVDFAVKFKNSSPKQINQIGLYFTDSSVGQQYNVAIYDTTGSSAKGNAPGNTLWSQTGLTVANSGLVNIPVSPSLNVTADYYVVVSQTGNSSLFYASEFENPIRQGVFLSKNTNWVDFSNMYNLKLKVDVQYFTTVPVEINKFYGENRNKRNFLSWETSTESNNLGFEILRSSNRKDFTSIGFISTKANNGNSNQNMQYAFDDQQPLIGSNFYQLKQVDKNGKTELSKIILLNNNDEETNAIALKSLFPNPAYKILNCTLVSSSNQNIQFLIKDVLGNLTFKESKSIIKGANYLSFNVEQLKSGIYFLTVLSEKGVQFDSKQFEKF